VSGAEPRLSVPAIRTLPRPLSSSEVETYLRIADTLCPGGDGVAYPSAQPDFLEQLDVALAARSDSFERIIELLHEAEAVAEPDAWLRMLHDSDSDGFQALSAVAAGAFLMLPPVRAAVGYPGQRRSVPRIDEAADEIGDGILDLVLARGHFYVPTPAPETR